MLSGRIGGFLKQAASFAKTKNNPAETLTIKAVIITPKAQYNTLGVIGLGQAADFAVNHVEDIRISVRLQPGLYFDHILKYRDDLKMQLLFGTEEETVLREYVAIPLFDSDPRSKNNNTADLNLDAKDDIQFGTYEFQLMDKVYYKLRHIPSPKTLLMTTVENALINIVESYSKNANLNADEKYKGLFFVRPTDNLDKLRQVIVPENVQLKDIPVFLQNANEYGIYSKGLGSFFKQGYWWVYPLFNTNRVEGYVNPADIIRVPKDKVPTLDATFYKADNGLTIIVTGESEHSDSADIRKQNKGVGSRLIMADAVSGQTGMHYKNGRAVATRKDRMQEFKLSERRNGEENTPLKTEPTSNVCRSLSEASMNEGEIMWVGWDNGDVGHLEPGHPIRFQYLGEDDMMVIRKGILLGYQVTYIPMNIGTHMQMKRKVELKLFLKRQERYKAEKQA